MKKCIMLTEHVFMYTYLVVAEQDILVRVCCGDYLVGRLVC